MVYLHLVIQELIHGGSSTPADTGTRSLSNRAIFTSFSQNTVNVMNTVSSKHKTEFREKNKSPIRKLYLA